MVWRNLYWRNVFACLYYKRYPFIVKEALKTVPSQSEFYQCMNDVINWHKKYPKDWKQTWLEVQKKWADDIGCPEGVFAPFNIDAKVNAAYVCDWSYCMGTKILLKRLK